MSYTGRTPRFTAVRNRLGADLAITTTDAQAVTFNTNGTLRLTISSTGGITGTGVLAMGSATTSPIHTYTSSSGTVTVRINTPGTSTAGVYTITTAGTARAAFGVAGNTNDFITGSSQGDVTFGLSTAGKAFLWSADSGSTIHAKLNSTGFFLPTTVTSGHVIIGATGGQLTSEAQLAVSRGGTNIASYTAGDTLYATGSTTLAKLPIGASGRTIVSNGSAPTWSSAPGVLGPSGSTTDNAMVRWDGTSAAAVQNSGVIVDDSDNMAMPGVLTVGASSTTPTHTYTSSSGTVVARVNTPSATTAGAWRLDMNGTQRSLWGVAGVANHWVTGSAQNDAVQVLYTAGKSFLWSADGAGTTIHGKLNSSGLALPTSISNGVVISTDSAGTLTSETSLDETRGGTGLTSYTTGDVLYASGANTLAKLPISSNGSYLTIAAGVPAWTSITAVTGPGSSTDRAIATWNGTGGTALRNTGVTINASDTLIVPGNLSAGSGIATAAHTLTTASGAVTLSLISAASNNSILTHVVGASTKYFSGAEGTAGSIVTGSSAGDWSGRVPSGNMNWSADNGTTRHMFLSSSGLSLSNLTSGHVLIGGSGGLVSSEASLLETRGGTHQTTYTTGDTLYASASNTLSKLAIGATNTVLRVVAGIPSWVANAVFSGGTSTDNAIMRWDGTTGLLSQNSGCTIDDSNNVAMPGTITAGSTSATPVHTFTGTSGTTTVRIDSPTSQDGILVYRVNAVTKAIIGISGSGALVTGTSAGDYCIRTAATQHIVFSADNGATIHGTISGTSTNAKCEFKGRTDAAAVTSGFIGQTVSTSVIGTAGAVNNHTSVFATPALNIGAGNWLVAWHGEIVNNSTLAATGGRFSLSSNSAALDLSTIGAHGYFGTIMNATNSNQETRSGVVPISLSAATDYFITFQFNNLTAGNATLSGSIVATRVG